jgi:sugar-specific transcriptional regulator TrmB
VACQKPNSSLSLSKAELKAYLEVVKLDQLSTKEVAENLQLPMFKVRSKFRELKNFGYVLEIRNENYIITKKGLEKLSTL